MMDGVLLTMAQEGALYDGVIHSVIVLWAGKHCERLCGDLLALHQRKCTLGKIETLSRLASDEVTNLWVKLYNLYRV
jgi:hypothetical protein